MSSDRTSLARTFSYLLGFSLLGSFALILGWRAHATAFEAFVAVTQGRDDRETSGMMPFSKAFVISLPRRQDRRKEMEYLRQVLDLRWTYIEATESDDPAIHRALSRVRTIRKQAIFQEGLTHEKLLLADNISFPFTWPAADLIARDMTFGSSSPSPSTKIDDNPFLSPLKPLSCASSNFTIFPYSSTLPSWRVLTPARVACWHSHLRVIQALVESRSPYVSIILEDDIDMEKDIQSRIAGIWPALPSDWDIVFLGTLPYGLLMLGFCSPFPGHCWSNETFYPPLFSLPVEAGITRLHSSYKPKCTHAYALSPSGARRLLAHLTHPPFAYSRAIDQALSWLVESGRLTAFSVVPSIVVQRKIISSDVVDQPSAWQDVLDDGVFGRTMRHVAG